MIPVADQVCNAVLLKAHSGVWGRNHRYNTAILNQVAQQIPIEVRHYVIIQVLDYVKEELSKL